MERLQQAIERARRERQGQLGRVPDIESRDNTAQPHLSTPRLKTSQLSGAGTRGKFKTTGLPPNPIRYSRSRVVSLNETHMEANRIIAGRSGDERVEAYHQLRTQVLHTLQKNHWNTLAITSPMKNAGKTLTSVNLAISLAKEVNHSVLLVDVDLSHPDVHNTLGVDLDYGLIDLLTNRATIEQVLFNPSIQRLLVLPCKPTEDYSSELLSSPEMSALLDDVTTRYENRIVIFDLPPLLRNDDALKFTPYVDATLMVVEAGETTPEEFERSSHLLKNANLIGTILNKAR